MGRIKIDIDRKQQLVNLTLAGVVGQVGCLTLFIVLAAVLGGLWLDAHFGTRPVLTIGLLVASIPVSLVVMLLVVRKATSLIKPGSPKEGKSEEVHVGNQS
jgi:MFS-type transporter involved in bile tolerance (Atg22 family)